LSRIWKYKEDEGKAVDAACAHLKRGCFDIFKLIFIETRRQYDELIETGSSTLSIIDNGKFIHDMLSSWVKINELGRAARMSEGDSRDEEHWHIAFDKWEVVMAECADFTKKFYLNESVGWAKAQAAEREREITAERKRKEWRRGLVTGVVSSLIAAVIMAIVSWSYYKLTGR